MRGRIFINDKWYMPWNGHKNDNHCISDEEKNKVIEISRDNKECKELSTNKRAVAVEHNIISNESKADPGEAGKANRYRNSKSKRPLPPEPTRYWPGTIEKICIMQWRWSNGYQIHHPNDFGSERNSEEDETKQDEDSRPIIKLFPMKGKEKQQELKRLIPLDYEIAAGKANGTFDV